MSQVFWKEDPQALFTVSRRNNILLGHSLSTEENLNALTRIIIMSSFALYLITRKKRTLILGSLSILFILGVSDHLINSRKEGLVSADLKEKQVTLPTKDNPLMNVMPGDYMKDPNRPKAAKAFKPKIRKLIDRDTKNSIGTYGIDPRLFQELGGGGAGGAQDMYFNEAMNAFYTTPNTQIPNSQTDFANWCYGNMPSAKEGNRSALLAQSPPNWTQG